MKQHHDGLVDERRDLELGAALAALPHPELPDDMDARLRAAIETERRRRRRRRSVAIELGDFTNWLWPQPASGSAPTYSWIYELIDAGSRTVDSAAASARPFSDTGLDLNIVVDDPRGQSARADAPSRPGPTIARDAAFPRPPQIAGPTATCCDKKVE